MLANVMISDAGVFSIRARVRQGERVADAAPCLADGDLAALREAIEATARRLKAAWAPVLLFLIIIAPAGPSWGGDAWLSGEASSRYRLRHTDDGRDGDARDQDVSETLSLEAGRGRTDRISLSAMGRVTADIDGDRKTSGASAFDSVTDSYQDPVNGRLYHAYADIRRLGPIATARVGRQSLVETPFVLIIDGALVRTEPVGRRVGLALSAYGGVPARIYESSARGDRIGGAAVELSPWPGARARGDFLRIEDEALNITHEDDVAGVSLRQSLGAGISANGRYTWIEGLPRDVEARLALDRPGQDLSVSAAYAEMFNPQANLALDIDSFYALLRSYVPYREYRLRLHKGIAGPFSVDGGGQVRELADEADAGVYNREFWRAYGGPTLTIGAFTASATAEVWEDDQDRRIGTYGADLDWRATERLRFRAGTAYELWRYDLLSDVERERVRSAYVGIDAKLAKAFKASVRYTAELADHEDYGTLDVGVRSAF